MLSIRFIPLLYMLACARDYGLVSAAEETDGTEITPFPKTDVSDMKATIGVHTQYLTKWIGIDSNYITQTVKTITAVGAPVTVATQNVNIQISTNEQGDMTVLTGPALLKDLEEAYQKAPQCDIRTKLRARDSLCGFDAFFELAGQLEVMPEVQLAIGKRSFVKSTDLANFFKYSKLGGRMALIGGAVYVVVASAFKMFEGIDSYLMTTWKLRHSDRLVVLPHVVKIPLRLQGDGKKEEKGCILKADDPKGKFRGCEFVSIAVSSANPMTTEWLDFQAQILFQNTLPPAECTGPMAAVSQEVWKRVVDNFCKEFPGDIPKDHLKTISLGELNIQYLELKGNREFVYKFSFSDKPGQCSPTCAEIYHSFTKSKSCSLEYLGTQARSMSAIIKQDCGDAAYEIITGGLPNPPPPPSTPVYNTREHLLVPQCDSGGLDIYHRQDLFNGATLFCEGMDGTGAWGPWGPWGQAFQSTKNKFVEGARNITHTNTPYRGLRPVSGPGLAEGRYFIIDLDVDLKGCALSTGDSVTFDAKLSKDECMSTVMTMIDGCPPYEGSRKPVSVSGTIMYFNCLRWTIRSTTEAALLKLTL